MASIEKRVSKDGTRTSYRVIWRDRGERQTQTFADHAAAKQWKAVLEKAGHDTSKAERAVLSAISHVPTLDQAIEKHIATLTDLTPFTVQTYQRQARIHISPVLGYLPVNAITRDDVAAWVVGLRDKGLAPKSIKNIHALLSSAFSTAVDRQWCESNPCARARLPRVSKRDDAKEFLTHGEFALILANMDPYFRPFTMFLVSTGLRFSEAAALASADFSDAGNGEYIVRVSKAWKEDRVKGRYIGEPKSDAAHRDVQLDAATALAVAPQVAAAKPGEPVFRMKRGGLLNTSDFRSKAWLPAIRAAQCQGLRKTPRVHDLRHTFASWQLTEGLISMDELAKIMGHESSKTTYAVYYHLMPDSRRQAAAAMNGIMGKVAASLEAVEGVSREGERALTT